MGLRLGEEDQGRVDALEAELRIVAQALGLSLGDELARLAPGVTRPSAGDEEIDAVLVSLDLDREGTPDPLSLVACVEAHGTYVARRGAPGGVSAGALALARLLVWAQRAAMLGPTPSVKWIGPAPRAPEPEAGAYRLAARCAVEVGGTTRRAEAVAVVVPAAET